MTTINLRNNVFCPKCGAHCMVRALDLRGTIIDVECLTHGTIGVDVLGAQVQHDTIESAYTALAAAILDESGAKYVRLAH